MSEEDPPTRLSEHESNSFYKTAVTLSKIVDGPVTLFKEKILDPIREKNKTYYFHRRFRRVPTIDECDVTDITCYYEANEQYKRDKLVEGQIIQILRQRLVECEMYYGPPEHKTACVSLREDYDLATANWMGKYGDLTCVPDVRFAFMKQKHRLLWERRYGPVGTGMTPVEQQS